MERRDLIRKLLETWHLNIEERAVLGTPPVMLDEVIDIIREELDRHGHFPVHVNPEKGYEGTLIQGAPNGSYRLIMWECNAFGQIGAPHAQTFRSLERAIHAYLSQEYPRHEIDGIPIR